MNLIKIIIFILIATPVFAECTQNLATGDLVCVEGNVSYIKPSSSSSQQRLVKQQEEETKRTKKRTEDDLQEQLDKNDAKSIRAIRSYLLTQSAEDLLMLKQLDDKAKALRNQLKVIRGE